MLRGCQTASSRTESRTNTRKDRFHETRSDGRLHDFLRRRADVRKYLSSRAGGPVFAPAHVFRYLGHVLRMVGIRLTHPHRRRRRERQVLRLEAPALWRTASVRLCRARELRPVSEPHTEAGIERPEAHAARAHLA